jgi:hypothetical protein
LAKTVLPAPKKVILDMDDFLLYDKKVRSSS